MVEATNVLLRKLRQVSIGKGSASSCRFLLHQHHKVLREREKEKKKKKRRKKKINKWQSPKELYYGAE